jgi:DNA mismatch repair protein MutS2
VAPAASPEPEHAFEDRTNELIDRAFGDLEWTQWLEAIATRCMTQLGQRFVLALRPAKTESGARARAQRTAEVLELSRHGTELPALNVPDAAPVIERIARGGVASGPELHQVKLGLRAVGELARFLAHHAARAPTLADHLATEPTLRVAREELERCIEEGGVVSDRASPELDRARRNLTHLRQQIRARLGELIHRYREALQDGYIAERDGRYVLPVRADAPFRVHGMVLGSSASGATLYVEPQEIAALGNRLKLAEAEAEHQEALVLARLSEALAPQSPALLRALDACGEADALRAVELFARKARAEMLPFGAAGTLELKGARHPLLALAGQVVANDLAIGSGRALVLSGPNAGGKTVALKCLGLAALAQSCGLPFPAEAESSAGFFEAVYSDIGDDQSLARSLSTFSGHIETVRDLVARAHPGVLVLLDELAGGTDPEEGAALAVAVLEGLMEQRAAVVVTTHYERLKELAAESSWADNAAVGFDFERLEPTFRLELGRPGASSALAVARRHGLPEALVARAGRLLPDTSRRRELLLQELERKQVELEDVRREVEREREQLAELSRQMELEQRRWAERERAELSRAGQELTRAVREARAEVQRVTKEIGQKAQDRQELRQAERAIDRAASLVALGSELDQRPRPAPQGPRALELAVGTRVRLRGMNTTAEVIETPDRGQVRVLAGAMKLTVRLDQVELVSGTASPKKSSQNLGSRNRPTLPASAPLAAPAPPRTEDVTLDLRGQRVEAGLEQLDGFIDVLLRRGESVGFVLHGHGTGAMKEAVRSHLRSLDLVSESRPAERDEGGDAFTIFWLRD